MLYRSLSALVLAAALCSCATKRDPGDAQNAPQPVPSGYMQSSSMRSTDYLVEGPVPAMERGRKVNDQECTKPIDPLAGNLRCK